ncbi:hypothetical protein [Candidatus Nasuia deltocephalinicola]|uniref:hypothetical protein n=1 Tax=Candidatus Nasuia deltocephalincola TaxID=1160784 RepID=UPI00216B2192|nr:hypothetical protein [Candidatus Nasuia deltocephalinicola]
MFLKISFLFGIETHIFSIFNNKIFNFFDYFSFKNFKNNKISFFDIGCPGILPTFNLYFLKKIVFFGFFLKIFLFYFSFFVRKNYFYPDMPKNYQITQHFSIFNKGLILIYNNFYNLPYYKFIKIIKIHLEEDSSKIIYKLNYKISNLDFNRSNTLLFEIVSSYDIKNFYEIYIYLFNIKKNLFFKKFFINKNIFRFDLNLSVKYFFYEFLNFKVEVKNLNSFFILKNVFYFEIKRQIFNLFFNIFFNQTKFYDLLKNKTYFARFKDNFFNYKYYIEPDKNFVFLNINFILISKYKIFLYYFIYIYFIYNFKKFFYFNFYLLEFLIFIFKFNINFIINFVKKFSFLFEIYKKIISYFQIISIFKCLFNNIFSYFIFKKIFFLIFKIKSFKSITLIYKIILLNDFILNINIYFFINFLILKNIKFVHIYFFKKKIFNFFLGLLVKFNFNYKKFIYLLNLKLVK